MNRWILSGLAFALVVYANGGGSAAQTTQLANQLMETRLVVVSDGIVKS